MAFSGVTVFGLGNANARNVMFRADRTYPGGDFLLRYPYGKLVRIVRRNQNQVPILSIIDQETRSLMLQMLGLSGSSSETAVKLADEFTGTVSELAETAKLLER